MAMLAYNHVTPKTVILYNDEPYIVLSSHVFRKQQRKPVNITKIKNLISGRVVEVTFHQNENIEEAELENRTITFIYEQKGEFWFHTAGNPGDRFPLSGDVVGDAGKFIKPKSDLEAIVFNDEIIGVKIPIKVELRVTEAMEAVKGNTAQGAQKEVKLETGTMIMAPMFIGEGDVIAVNTETGQYAERITKA
jgi:elongation factor P